MIVYLLLVIRCGHDGSMSLDATNPNRPLNSSLPLTGECVTFTGTLASMTHQRPANWWNSSADDRPVRLSRRVDAGRRRRRLAAGRRRSCVTKTDRSHGSDADGAELRIVSESDWLHLIGLNEQRSEIQRAYTPAMLSRLLGLPVSLIRRWARIGLIRPVRRVCRLPYFDFREVSSAQRLAQLLDEGVTPETLEKSLTQLSRSLAGTDRSLAQLTLLVQDDKVVVRDQHGVVNPAPASVCWISTRKSSTARLSIARRIRRGDESGTADKLTTTVDRCTISFLEASLRLDDRAMKDWTADEWFHEGCRLAEESAFESAVNAFRNSLSLLAVGMADLADPNDCAHRETDSRIRPMSISIWQMSCIESATQKPPSNAIIARSNSLPTLSKHGLNWAACVSKPVSHEAAEEAFLTAIAIHEANPDALLHYAQLLDATNGRKSRLTTGANICGTIHAAHGQITRDRDCMIDSRCLGPRGRASRCFA